MKSQRSLRLPALALAVTACVLAGGAQVTVASVAVQSELEREEARLRRSSTSYDEGWLDQIEAIGSLPETSAPIRVRGKFLAGVYGTQTATT